jgi:hypothetical protein
MPAADMTSDSETLGSGSALDRRRRYVVPSLWRYGTLADLTKNMGGSKNGNDGQGGGCGNNMFMTSCLHQP